MYVLQELVLMVSLVVARVSQQVLLGYLQERLLGDIKVLQLSLKLLLFQDVGLWLLLWLLFVMLLLFIEGGGGFLVLSLPYWALAFGFHLKDLCLSHRKKLLLIYSWFLHRLSLGNIRSYVYLDFWNLVRGDVMVLIALVIWGHNDILNLRGLYLSQRFSFFRNWFRLNVLLCGFFAFVQVFGLVVIMFSWSFMQ